MKSFAFFLLLFSAVGYLALAQEVYQAHTHVQLVSEQNAVLPGTTFWAGLHFMMDEDWHIYWQNPGDAGLAPKVKWDLPPGVKAGGIQWPYPKRIGSGGLMTYGYGQEVFLLVPVSVDRSFSGTEVSLHADVHWLTCQEACIPGHAKLNISLPVHPAGFGDSFNGFKSFFDRTRQQFPQSLPGISSYAVLKGHQWHLNIQSPFKKPAEITFYPFADSVIENAAGQVTRQTGDGYEVLVAKSHLYQGAMTSLEGIAVNPVGWDSQGQIKSVLVQAPVEMPSAHVSFWLACLFAFLGGLILNLMPCVLPVLSIKVLHLVERHPDKTVALRHSFLYALGILVSVWALGFLLAVLKAAGKLAGWGFQFQSPVFVLVVALILLVLALNLFGVFEFSAPAIGGMPMPHGLKASFLSGIVTTIVASPCTAPFMGTALAVAIGQPGFIGFGIFTFLGLGLALPFVLLSAFPALMSFLPRPGPWMVHLKRVLGVVLLACVLWLGWVFAIQTGLGDLTKIYKPAQGIRWQNYSAAAVEQARKSGHGVFIDFTAAWCINCQVNDRFVLQNKDVVKAFEEKGITAFKADWTKYDPAITQALASFGRDSIPVYVYYPPGSSTPVILPQLISPKMVTERIKQ